MKDATEIRVGNILQIDGKICKVLTQEIKGTGKFGKTVHLKLKALETGHMIEKSLRAEDRVDECDFTHVKMQYSYRDGDNFIFMNMQTFEQFTIPASVVGKQAVFLKENMEIDVEFVGEKPVSIAFPKTAELEVSNCPPPTKGGNDSTYKEAELENGLKVLVPQFIKIGDRIQLDVDSLDYLERVTKKHL